jgi:hypothetical protein
MKREDKKKTTEETKTVTFKVESLREGRRKVQKGFHGEYQFK